MEKPLSQRISTEPKQYKPNNIGALFYYTFKYQNPMHRLIYHKYHNKI